MFPFRTFATICCKHAPTNFDFCICLSVRMSANKKSGGLGGGGGVGKGVVVKHYIGDFIITLPCLEYISTSECTYLV